MAIDATTGNVVFRHGSKKLGAREKVLAYLLGRATRVTDGRGYRYEPTVKITEKFPKEPDSA